jgi:hypothetical protein
MTTTEFNPAIEATALEIADLFDAIDIGGPHATNYNAPAGEFVSVGIVSQQKWIEMSGYVNAYCGHAVLFEKMDGLSVEIRHRVTDILTERSDAESRIKSIRRFQDRRAEFAAIKHPALRVWALAEQSGQPDSRGRANQSPEPVTLKWLAGGSRNRDGSTFEPQPVGRFKATVGHGLRIGYRQASYADHSISICPLIPATGATIEGINTALRRMGENLRTANGYAGVGSTFDMTAERTDRGWVLVIDRRSSIAD